MDWGSPLGSMLFCLRKVIAPITGAFGCLFAFGDGTRADCVDRVNEAWWNLLSTRFSFEIESEGTNHVRVSGAFQWPSAMRYSVNNKEGRYEQVFVGARKWRYSAGRWHGGKSGFAYPGTALIALPLYAANFAIRHMPIESLEPVACEPLVERDGQHYFVYRYRQKRWLWGSFIDHDTIYVDARTGWLTRQEIEREFLDKPEAGKQLLVTTFRVDPALTIGPPKEAAQ